MSKKKKISLSSFLKAKKLLREDKALQHRFDSNKDGNLDPDEQEQAAKILGKEIHASDQKASKSSAPPEKDNIPPPNDDIKPLSSNIKNILCYDLRNKFQYVIPVSCAILIVAVLIKLLFSKITEDSLNVDLGVPYTFLVNNEEGSCFLRVTRSGFGFKRKQTASDRSFPFIYKITDPKGKNVFTAQDAGHGFRSEFSCKAFGTYTLLVEVFKRGLEPRKINSNSYVYEIFIEKETKP